MDTAETDRAKFAEKAGLFAAYLPYAVMFGSVERWTRAFAGLDTAQAVSSYCVGSSAFKAMTLGSSFEGFSSTLASTVVRPPPGAAARGSPVAAVASPAAAGAVAAAAGEGRHRARTYPSRCRN